LTRSEATFSTRQVLNILHEAGLDVGVERLKVWHRRGIVPGNGVGKGHARSYTLQDLILIASLVFMSRRLGQLREPANGFSARGLAEALAESVYAAFQSGPDGTVARSAHVYVLTEQRKAGTPVLEKINGDSTIRSVAEKYATGTATIVQPRFFALQLVAAIQRVCDPPPQSALRADRLSRT
jgi:hypothetical protein